MLIFVHEKGVCTWSAKASTQTLALPDATKTKSLDSVYTGGCCSANTVCQKTKLLHLGLDSLQLGPNTWLHFK